MFFGIDSFEDENADEGRGRGGVCDKGRRNDGANDLRDRLFDGQHADLGSRQADYQLRRQGCKRIPQQQKVLNHVDHCQLLRS
ncbi:unnamed protein product [Toxocara canis]|uniref:Uncharacterized protein n=1 Tax=Toxocara canis TaxID=6265 RepID=A0A183V7X9_TOXCA|nr:unnamed protein product [Toxocara canis]